MSTLRTPHARLLLMLILAATASVHAAPPGSIDGRGIAGDYGPAGLLATQTNRTGFGNQQINQAGSELNQLFATNDGDFLYVGLTGNLEPGEAPNRLLLFIESVAGQGQGSPGNPLAFFDGGALVGMAGSLLPLAPDDNPVDYDYAIEINGALPAGSPPEDAVYFADLRDLTSNTSRFLGGNDVNSSGAFFVPDAMNVNGFLFSYNAGNFVGVPGCGDQQPCDLDDGATVAARAATATFGFELAIPLADLGLGALDFPAEVKLFAYLTNADGLFGSNQGLPPLRDPFDTVPADSVENAGSSPQSPAIEFSNDGAVGNCLSGGPSDPDCQYAYFARAACVTLDAPVIDCDPAGHRVVIFQESFESRPGGPYTLSDSFDDGFFDFFGRYPVPEPVVGNAARNDFQFGWDGAWGILGQDHDGAGFGATQTVTIAGIDVSQVENLFEITLALGALNSEPDFQNYEEADGDGIRIYATLDGNPPVLLGQFAPPADGAGDLSLDEDLDGIGDELFILAPELRDVSFGVRQLGGTLDIDIELTSTESFEPLAIDNLRVTVPGEDCDFNGVLDACDIAGCTAPDGGLICSDCNSNDILDGCEIASCPAPEGGEACSDCNTNMTLDVCEIADGSGTDANTNGILDECEAITDCNSNGIDDFLEIVLGTATDVNFNGVPDECDPDCNTNGIPDDLDITLDISADVNSNGVPDECEPDCNTNAIPDAFEIAEGTAADVNTNGVPDECEPDCNTNAIPDAFEIAEGTAADVNTNGVPDECEPDCNTNGIPDAFEIAEGTAADVNTNGVPDECEPDCNTNAIPDAFEIAQGSATDYNSNGIPDRCDILQCTSNDLNYNRIPDETEIAEGSAADANTNGIIDEAEQPACQHSYIPMQGGAQIRDDALAAKLKALLVNSNGTANVKDAKFFFAQCYGGGMLDDIKGELGTSVPWVGGSASRHDEVSYGDRDNAADPDKPEDDWAEELRQALANRTVMRALKQAAEEDRSSKYNWAGGDSERPQYRRFGAGSKNITLKDPDANSHHAVILAGRPDGHRHTNDARLFCERLKAEWGNLDTNGTSVHVLFGDGTTNPCNSSGVPNTNSLAATTAGLCQVLEDLRDDLGDDEEFVFFVTDHGNSDAEAVNTSSFQALAPGTLLTIDVHLPAGYRHGLLRDPFNNGPLARITAIGAYPPDTISVRWNDRPVGFLDPAAIGPNGDNVTVLPLHDGDARVGVNSVTFDFNGTVGVNVVRVVFDLNGINTIPRPGWGDMDGDGDVDRGDLAAFVGCLGGPTGGLLVEPDCRWADIDGNGHVDLADYGLFQTVFTGALE